MKTKRRTLRGPSRVFAIVDKSLRVKALYLDRDKAYDDIEEGKFFFPVYDIVELPIKMPFLQTITIK